MKGRREKKITCFIAVAFAGLCLLFSGCSESRDRVFKDQEFADAVSPTGTAGSKAEEADYEEYEGIDEEENSGDLYDSGPAIRDDGDPCRNHSYRLVPGSVEILHFEKLLKNPDLQGETVFEVKRNDLSAYDITVTLEESEITEHSSAYSVWVVDLSEYAGSLFSQEGPVSGLVNRNTDRKGVNGVKFLKDNYYIVSEINGRRWFERAISELEEEELSDMLDGDMVFHFTDNESGRIYDFPLERIEMEREFHIASLVVEISIPDDLPSITAGAEMVFSSQQAGEIRLRCYFSSERGGHVTVAGPAYESDCF